MDDFYDSEPERKLCNLCGKDYDVSYLKRHQYRKHGLGSGRIRRISCPLCEETNFSFRVQLRTHIHTNHNTEIIASSFEFDNCDDFFSWLKDEQNSKKIRLYKARAAKKLEDGSEKWNYYCQYDNSRNYQTLPQEERRRALKNAGSCKMTGCCPAEVIVTKYITGKVHVQYYSTHIGHDVSIAHFNLSYECRRDLADKIEAGVSFDKILHDIRDVTDGKPKQDDLIISRKTLHNIAATIPITSWKLDPNAGTSVCLWVRSMETLDFNPVCLFKKQGEDHPVLEQNDFVLIIVTKIQAMVLREFGNRFICIKSTPGTKQYDFSLTTVLIVDDHEEPFPAAFLVSNRTDATVMEIFFSEICTQIDTVLSPTIFLSDDYPAYFKAWSKVMKPEIPPKRLLCTWNVDENWRLALNKIGGEHGKVNEKQVSVYRNLRLLLEEMNQVNFIKMLGQVMTDLMTDESTKCFGQYFKEKYVNRFPMWAYSFRVGTESVYIKTENFHRSIRKVYDKGLKMKRLDACIYNLLRIIRDKHLERTMKLTNKAPFVVQKLNAIHRKGMAIPNCDVEKNGSHFRVKSETNHTVVYTIEKIHNNCPFNCNLICRQCNACVHAYQCSCADFIIKCNMCKHVHKVCKFSTEKQNVNSSVLGLALASDAEINVDSNDESENVCMLSPDHQQPYDEAVQELNESIEHLIDVRDTKICCSVQMVKVAKRKIDEGTSILLNERSPKKLSRFPTPKKLCPRNRKAVGTKTKKQKPTSNQKQPSVEMISCEYYEPQEIDIEMVDVSTFDHVY